MKCSGRLPTKRLEGQFKGLVSFLSDGELINHLVLNRKRERIQLAFLKKILQAALRE